MGLGYMWTDTSAVREATQLAGLDPPFYTFQVQLTYSMDVMDR